MNNIIWGKGFNLSGDLVITISLLVLHRNDGWNPQNSRNKCHKHLGVVQKWVSLKINNKTKNRNWSVVNKIIGTRKKQNVTKSPNQCSNQCNLRWSKNKFCSLDSRQFCPVPLYKETSNDYDPNNQGTCRGKAKSD